MRVAIVARTRSFGGAEIHVLRSSQALERAGAEVCVSGLEGAPLVEEARRAGLHVVASRRRLCRAPRAADVIHVHEPRDVPAALVWACSGRRPVFVTRHLAASERRRGDPYHRLLARRLRYVAASRFVADSLEHAYPFAGAAVSVVPYGYDAPSTSAPSVPRGPGGVVEIGVVARLTPGKHHDDALRALRVLVDRGVDARLTAVGEETTAGARRAVLAEAGRLGLADRVRLLGHRRDVSRLLATFDALVHPTRAESFGLAVLEAMAAGVPVVAVAGGGVPEIVEHERTGLLAAPGDADALGVHLYRLVTDPALARGLAARARAAACERFGAAREAAGLMALYREAVAAHSAVRA